MERDPVEAKEARLSAWKRIGDLADAIKRQSEIRGNASACRAWAEEIRLQCVIIHNLDVVIDLGNAQNEE